MEVVTNLILIDTKQDHLIRIDKWARVKNAGSKGREAKYLLDNAGSAYILSAQE